MPGFGRRPSVPDPRDADYPIRALLPPTPSARIFRYWNQQGWWGDQGESPQCVAYASLHWLADGPVTQHAGPSPVVDPTVLYHECQLLDEIPGINYDGTTTRGAAKAMEARGYLESYHWGHTLDDVVQCLLELGPVLIGTNWYSGMMEPDEAGIIRVIGPVLGGHETVLNGVNTHAELVRGKNSWGRSWGHGGNYYLRFADLARLLEEEGEVLLAKERAVP